MTIVRDRQAVDASSADEFEAYVLDVIKAEHPEWIGADGACERCVAYYRSLDHALKLVE